MRFLFRLAATIALAVAVIMAVVDATRTVAASKLVMTPLATSWNSVSPHTLENFRQFVQTRAGPTVWDWFVTIALSQPGFIVFAVLALLFYLIGYKRQPRHARLSAGH